MVPPPAPVRTMGASGPLYCPAAFTNPYRQLGRYADSMGFISVAGIPTWAFVVLAAVAGAALVVRSVQITTGDPRVRFDYGLISLLGTSALTGMVLRQQSGRRVSELLILAGFSYVVASYGSSLDELHEEVMAQRGGASPGPVATRLFIRTLALTAVVLLPALLVFRGW